MRNSKISILLVEDDKVDIMTIKRAFKDLKIANPVNVCENGLEALEFLENSNNNKPGIILLDINMPTISGWDFIREYRKMMTAVESEKIKLFVLTSSQYYQDAELADQHREVQKLFTKPLTASILKEIDSFL